MKKTISVFFSGTGFKIDDLSFVASSLYQRAESSETQINMGFNGCGVDFGFWGEILGSGLDKQCDEVIQRIREELSQGHELTLNVYGMSRGGITALMLAKQLSSVDPTKLSINLALLDPVPGNLIISASLDPFDVTLANKVSDLSACKPLKKVLALYPYKPLPDLAFHAPLLPTYPKHVELVEEVVPGKHASAEQTGWDGALTRLRVEKFFVENGSQFRVDNPEEVKVNNQEDENKNYCKIYESQLQELEWNGPITRDLHSSKGVYITAKPGAQYFNQHHKQLAGGDKDATVAVAIEENPGFFPSLKRRIAANASFEVQGALTTVLIPILLALWVLAGPLGFGVTVGLIITSAILWEPVLKPLTSWALERFFYPQYSVCAIDCADSKKEQNSPHLMLEGLGGSALSARPEPERPYQGVNPLSASVSTNQGSTQKENLDKALQY